MSKAPFSELNVRVASVLLGLGLCAACEEPKQDAFRSQGGISPDPSGIIEGAVAYVGPKPACERDESGAPTRVRGRVVMTLFDFDNPPPPEGTATGAKNLLYVPADALFTLDDCAVDARPPERIMRAADFRWPTIPLDPVKTTAYQIRAFYDHDEDMNPFFSVKNLPTQGDVVGGALLDIEQPERGFLPIEMPSQADAQRGFVFRGVTVAVANEVWTERPMFRMSENRVLSAEAYVQVAVSGFMADVPTTVRNLWNLSCARPDGGSDCGLSIQTIPYADIGRVLEYAGVETSFRKDDYAFYVEPVDVRTINADGPDVVLPDGKQDPHPLLGANLGILWSTPMTLFSRVPLDKQQAQVEALAGIPAVTLAGTPLLDEIATQTAFSSRIDIAVPPVAAVTLSAANPLCRVAYAAPGNTTRTFESRAINCGELPTGLYGLNVLSGVAGGERVYEPDATISETTVRFTGEGKRFSGQVWSVPNALGDEAQLGDRAVPFQGERKLVGDDGWAYTGEGLFVVHDPNPGPEKEGACDEAPDPEDFMLVDGEVVFNRRPVAYRGVCERDQEQTLESKAIEPGLPDIDGAACIPKECCDAVAHLCGLPLCEVVEIEVRGEARAIRSGPTEVTPRDGKNVPNCVPFEMPKACCGKLP